MSLLASRATDALDRPLSSTLRSQSKPETRLPTLLATTREESASKTDQSRFRAVAARRSSQTPLRSRRQHSVTSLGSSSEPMMGLSRSCSLLPTSFRSSAQYEAGCFSMQGQKLAHPGWPNQDAHLAMPLGHGKYLAAVFDGHGRNGHLASSRVRDLVEQMACSLALSIGSRSGAIVFSKLFSILHETLVAENLATYSGTTATIALIDASKGSVTIAFVGDSTSVVARGTDVVFFSKDHKIDEEVQRRIERRGGEVRETVCHGFTTRRVCAIGSRFPGLAMARALGDQEAHDLGVLGDPEICTVPFRPGSTLILASDGIWDKVSHREAARLVDREMTQAHDIQEVARRFASRSRDRYHPEHDIDDITAVIVTAAMV